MGTTAHIVTTGDQHGVIDTLVDRLVDLERRWTRFSDDNELARINGAAGSLTVVEPDTFGLIAAAVEGWRRTGGRFDPTVAPTMRSNGYDRTYASIGTAGAPVAMPSPGCEAIELFADAGAVRLPDGVELDFGGIGKGHAADLIATEAVTQHGLDGVCVNIGGDLRVVGRAPTPDGWVIELAAMATDGSDPMAVALAEGAVCTSRVDLRTWPGPDGEIHHLLDPQLGSPTDNDMVAVSVISGSATVAEVATKAAIVGGLSVVPAVVEEFGAAAVAVDRHGRVTRFGDVDAYLARRDGELTR